METDVPGCVDCNGSCCCDVLVGITGYDAWRIARANALRFEDFVTVASAEPGDLGAFRLGDGYAALVLQRNPHEPHACAFLMRLPRERRRCGTYASRPTVCRVYPMEPDEPSPRVRANAVCPPGAWDAARLDVPAWSADLGAYALEWQAYASAIAAWNASTLDGLPEFFAFLISHPAPPTVDNQEV